jgi:hypothetical protein
MATLNSGIIETWRILDPGAALLKPEACEPSPYEPSLEEFVEHKRIPVRATRPLKTAS